jgi:hypothetical protein
VGVTALSSISNAITAVTAGNHKSGIYGQHVGGVDGFGGNFKTALGNGVHAESAGGGAGLEAVGTNNAYALKATSANQTAIAADATSGGSAMTVVQHGGGDGLRTSALGGGWAAYLDGNAKVTGNLAVNGNISGHDLGQTLWAEVRADGTLIRGRGAVSSSREDTGEYWIVFDRSVDLCGVVANTVIIPGGGDWGTFEAASATVGAGAAGHEGQAAVAIRSHLGTLSDARFTLVVIC